MKPFERLAVTQTPDGSWLELCRHDGDFVIRADGYDLMTSRIHGSEAAMMSLACPRPRARACVLIGGLGMGYTLRATLDLLPGDASVVVAELVPEVVEWNRGPLGPLANHPLNDPRITVALGDVANIIRDSEGRFDAILLDVDNGPSAFTQRGNSRLYSRAGLAAAHRALRHDGALAVWSVEEDAQFERNLRAAGFTPATHRMTVHGKRHVVFVGNRRPKAATAR
jgi:spermidine synthase